MNRVGGDSRRPGVNDFGQPATTIVNDKILMKKTCLLLACLCLAAPSTGFAAKADGKKAKLIAKYDKNANGVIDKDEMEALRKDFAKDKDGELKQYDTNGDGKLDDAEIAAIKPGSGKKSGGEKKADAKKKDSSK